MAKIVRTFIDGDGTIIFVVKRELEFKPVGFSHNYIYDAFWTDFLEEKSLGIWDYNLTHLEEELKRWDSTIQLFDLGDYILYAKMEHGEPQLISLDKEDWEGGCNMLIKASEMPVGIQLQPLVCRFVRFWKGEAAVDDRRRYLG